MVKFITQLMLKFNSMATREKIMIFAAGVVLPFIIWYYILWDRIQLKKVKIDQEISIVAKEVEALKLILVAEQESFNKLSKTHALEAQRSQQQEQTASMVPKDQNQTQRIIVQGKMLQILKDLLYARHDLFLVELKTLPVVPLMNAEGGAVILYKHGVIIKFRGTYFAVERYLDDLERLHWHLFWSNLDYRVRKYPEADVTLELYGISRSKGFIDV